MFLLIITIISKAKMQIIIISLLGKLILDVEASDTIAIVKAKILDNIQDYDPSYGIGLAKLGYVYKGYLKDKFTLSEH